jgi:MoCo/4Fe-4S cofactor protein with predicted Tat translocation signal
MSSNKKYWKSVEELKDNSLVETLAQNEFVEPIPTEDFLGNENLADSSTTRRDFLKYVGFSTAAATLAACEGPVKKSIPYVLQPDTIIPGVADYYATTMYDGYDFANILVKTREGRPIKVENNTIDTNAFSANARVHASILSLYDSKRLRNSALGGKKLNWSEVNLNVTKNLEEAKTQNKAIVILTNTIASPSTSKLISEFIAKYPNAKHIQYDAISEDAALNAFQEVYGERALANYDFSKANVIVSVGADFLGDWQGGSYEAGYAKGRIPQKGKMSKHYQFEANMTLSGAAADKRIPMTNAQQKNALLKIYSVVTGNPYLGGKLEKDQEVIVINAANQLKQAGSKSVLVSGIDDVNAQKLVLAINNALTSEAFINTKTRQIRKGDSKEVNQLIASMNSGSVHTILMYGVNPLYTLSNAKEFETALSKVKFSASITQKLDETAVKAKMAIATSHYLENWGDLELVKGTYSLVQPTINPLFNTKQFEECLLSWTGNTKSVYDYIKENSATYTNGKTFNQTIHDGLVSREVVRDTTGTSDINAAASALASSTAVKGFELHLYSKIGMGDGQQANNPWLQEFPDPITRVCWGNYATVSRIDAEEKGLENWNVANGAMNGSLITLKLGNKTLENVPVVVQPGQAKGTIGLSFGYGKIEGLKEEMQNGVNAFALYLNNNSVQDVNFEKESGEHEFAAVQLQKTLMGRGDIIKETTLKVFSTEDAKVWNKPAMVSLDHAPIEAIKVDLWESFDRSIGPHFNLSIDLNACTGCGACVIACHAENNVPVVGKSEMRKSRDMHWLRIDRYYSSEDTFDGDNKKKANFSGLFGDNGSLGGFGEMENPADNPQVAFQPVMCQHCNHASCETVCPVAATSHGRQGQNQMAYNRCVGTRYCANNCAYKVRRFNWFLYNGNDEFDYHMNNDLGRMVLNPDVNVRSRGVMEKCSMCIQMTQMTILTAKKEGRPVGKDEFKTACSAACTTGAMKFGDINNAESDVAKLTTDDRMYHLLEHVGTKPNVMYHVKVRNT